MKLANKECASCRDATRPLKGAGLKELQSHLKTGWKVIDQHHLERRFKFSDFRTALDFTNHVGKLAEKQGHHPDIYLAWGEVRLQIWTHKVSGLTESDFVLAGKVDRIKKGA